MSRKIELPGAFKPKKNSSNQSSGWVQREITMPLLDPWITDIEEIGLPDKWDI